MCPDGGRMGEIAVLPLSPVDASMEREDFRLERFGAFMLLAAVVAACGSTPAVPGGTGPAPATIAAGGTAMPVASPPAVGGTAAPMPSANVPVPGDVTLADIGGNAPVSGVAHFTAEGSDQVAISVELEGTNELLPFANTVTLAVIAGTCADMPEPAVSSAGDVGHQTVDVTNGKGEESLVVSLGTITASPHSVLVATAPGDINLACGDIGG